MVVLHKNTGRFTGKSKGKYLNDLLEFQKENRFSDDEILRFVAEEFPELMPTRRKRLAQIRSEFNSRNGVKIPEYDQAGNPILKDAHRPRKNREEA